LNPVLSIVIPVKNGSKTIERLLESLTSQTWLEFEVLLQDGNSSDNTIDIANKYRPFFGDRLRIFSEKDHGIYDAMNKGIDRARGEWLYFLGADDYLLNKVVLSQVFNFQKLSGYDFVYGDSNTEDYGTGYDGEFNLAKLRLKNICHQSIFVKKAVFDVLGRFDISYPALADWDFNFKCFVHPKIKCQYLDLGIAHHSGGGFAINHPDAHFISHINSIVDKYIKRYNPSLHKKNRIKRYLSTLKKYFPQSG